MSDPEGFIDYSLVFPSSPSWRKYNSVLEYISREGLARFLTLHTNADHDHGVDGYIWRKYPFNLNHFVEEGEGLYLS